MLFFQKLLLVLRCAALSALTVVLICGAVLLNTARQQTEEIPQILRNELEASRRELREALIAATTRIDHSVTSAASGLSDSATAQGDAARNMLDRQLEALRSDANRQIEAAVMRLDSQLTHANATVAEAAAVAVPARAAIAKIDSALPFYTDCDAGMCLANILYGVGKESERTLRSIDKTMQVIAEKSPPVADSLEKSAAAMEIRSRQSIFRNLFFNLKSAAK